MRFLIVAFLFLAGCDSTLSVKNSETTTLRATCKLKDFEGFPKKVSGPVTLELKSYITILIKNKDGSEQVEMTFPKSKCEAK